MRVITRSLRGHPASSCAQGPADLQAQHFSFPVFFLTFLFLIKGDCASQLFIPVIRIPKENDLEGGKFILGSRFHGFSPWWASSTGLGSEVGRTTWHRAGEEHCLAHDSQEAEGERAAGREEERAGVQPRGQGTVSDARGHTPDRLPPAVPPLPRVPE